MKPLRIGMPVATSWGERGILKRRAGSRGWWVDFGDGTRLINTADLRPEDLPLQPIEQTDDPSGSSVTFESPEEALRRQAQQRPRERRDHHTSTVEGAEAFEKWRGR